VATGQPAVYTVVQGDTLGNIAARYGVEADLIAAANQLNNNTLPAAGSQLFIPGSDGLLPPAAPNQAVHRVGPGDSLGGISVKYDISVQTIAAANNLPDINHVELGWILLIPREEIATPPGGATASPPAEPDTQATSYTVQFGDSLDSIARRFGVTTQALQEANGLTDANHIEVGQVLKIPR
jgi:LysM repeat protein